MFTYRLKVVGVHLYSSPICTFCTWVATRALRDWLAASIFNLNLKFLQIFILQKKNLPTGEVIFNVLGFAEHHNEDFLESLALIGTSDGSYSFVSPKEGKKDI